VSGRTVRPRAGRAKTQGDRFGARVMADARQQAGEVRFLCDAMLGGLARWLRATGYSAEFDVHAPDGALVRRALAEDKVLLTSDGGIMDRWAVETGRARVLFVPRGQTLVEQLAYVLRQLGLTLKMPRCMACNGKLEPVELADVTDRVPPKVRAACREFFRCTGCGRVLWHGTHWSDIQRRLARAVQLAGTPPPRDSS